LVLLILATTTIIGIGAVSASISVLKITANENFYNKLVNTAVVGIQTARLDIQALQGKGDRKNTTNNDYTGNPLTYWNIKNCGDLDNAPQATDSAAQCSSAATADGVVQTATVTGGKFAYFYEIRLLNRESKAGLIAGEQIGTTQTHQYITHSLASGCGTTSNLDARSLRAVRMIGGFENDYSAVQYSPKAAT
jgi:hypothetical protein